MKWLNLKIKLDYSKPTYIALSLTTFQPTYIPK